MTDTQTLAPAAKSAPEGVGDLTLSAAQALAALADILDRGGALPTGDMLAAKLGRADPSSARRTMRKLEERGLFSRDPFRITPDGRAVLKVFGLAGAPDARPGRPPVRHGDITGFPFNPRSTFDETAVAELAQSIKAAGELHQPILVRPDPDRPGKFQGIAGERRYRAIGMLIGMAASEDEAATAWDVDRELFVEIRDVDDASALSIAITENTDRQDMHELDECRAIEKLVKMRTEAGLSQADAFREAAAKLGAVKRTVEMACQIVRDCAPEALAAWGRGEIRSKRHCLALSRATHDDQRAVLSRIVRAEEGYRTEAEITARLAEIEEARNAPDLFGEGGSYTRAETWRALFGAAPVMNRPTLIAMIKRDTARPELALEAGVKAGHIEDSKRDTVRLAAKPGPIAFSQAEAWREAFSITKGKLGRAPLEERIGEAAKAAGCTPAEAIEAGLDAGAINSNGSGWFWMEHAPIVSTLETFDKAADRPELPPNEHGVYPNQDQVVVEASGAKLEIRLCHCEGGGHRFALSLTLSGSGSSAPIDKRDASLKTRAAAFENALANADRILANEARGLRPSDYCAETRRRQISALWSAIGQPGTPAFPNMKREPSKGDTRAREEIEAADRDERTRDEIAALHTLQGEREGYATRETDDAEHAFADALDEAAAIVADMIAMKRVSIKAQVAPVGPAEHRSEVKAAIERLFTLIAEHPAAPRDHGEACRVLTGGGLILLAAADPTSSSAIPAPPEADNFDEFEPAESEEG